MCDPEGYGHREADREKDGGERARASDKGDGRAFAGAPSGAAGGTGVVRVFACSTVRGTVGERESTLGGGLFQDARMHDAVSRTLPGAGGSP